VWSFLYGTNHGKYELILDNAPARSAELLARKRVDAALVPVIAYQFIEDLWLVPEVCVGAKRRVRSVCLVTKDKSPEQVSSVALDISSKTSVALTKIIFREFIGFEPVWKEAEPHPDRMLEIADCALLIGDPALVISDSASLPPNAENHLRKFDLVEIWRKFTGLGFVFAMWMTRSKICEIGFAAARDEGLNHLDEIISNYKSEIPLAPEDFKEYLSENISYSIDDSMQKGLELFFELAVKNKLIKKNKPLQFCR
jgi:chorismate dehydratase